MQYAIRYFRTSLNWLFVEICIYSSFIVQRLKLASVYFLAHHIVFRDYHDTVHLFWRYISYVYHKSRRWVWNVRIVCPECNVKHKEAYGEHYAGDFVHPPCRDVTLMQRRGHLVPFMRFPVLLKQSEEIAKLNLPSAFIFVICWKISFK